MSGSSYSDSSSSSFSPSPVQLSDAQQHRLKTTPNRFLSLGRRLFILLSVICAFTCLYLYAVVSSGCCTFLGLPKDVAAMRASADISSNLETLERLPGDGVVAVQPSTPFRFSAGQRPWRKKTDTEEIESRPGNEIYDYREEEVAYIDYPSEDGVATDSRDDDSKPSRIQRIRLDATKKLPQAIIIGVKKCGTRALLEYLRLHPDVRGPGPEPHFFDRHYQKGFEWYRNKMPPTIEGQMTIEKTPSYFVTKEVPRRIFNMSKNIKLLVIVRDPVVRAISDYTQLVQKRPWMRSFESKAFLNTTTRIVDMKWSVIRIGVYVKHLERWLQFFPLHRIHFVSGEELISDPAKEMEKVQDFLGLKRIISDKHFYFNKTKGFPCLKKTEGSGHPHCLGKTKGRTHPTINPVILKRLRDFYRPFNTKFYQITHRDFAWP